MSFLQSHSRPLFSSVLVSTTDYDDAGRAFSTIDPADKETRRLFDAADRVTSAIENYDPGSSANDANLAVNTTYTPDGQVETLTAVNPTTGDQTTTYEYGTTLADSAIARSDLLRATIYPDSVDSTDRVVQAYNRQGQVTQLTDQNGTVHQFEFDGLGRPTADKVTALGTYINNGVLRIETGYEVRGMPNLITSLDAASSGAVVNQVLRQYNDFGQLGTEYQEHGGAVNTSTTPSVGYGYADGSANTTRLEHLFYPNGSRVDWDYSGGSGDDDALSRPTALWDFESDLGHVLYNYLGLGSFVRAEYPQPQIRWDLVTGSGVNPYAGLDRFGRTIDCLWRNFGDSSDAERVLYGYDRASNRTWRHNTVAPDGQNDELYAYDGAQRLQDLQRGNLNSGHTAITDLNFAQQWGLDKTGNWGGFFQNDTGGSSWTLEQTRASNQANEITDITGGGWGQPAYDRAGNMVQCPLPLDPTSATEVTYDAWNRLVYIEADKYYRYDGLHRRVTKDDTGDPRHYYYSANWQVLEERLGSSPTTPDRQFLWGLRYIDDLVWRKRSVSGTLDETLYALQDANWNVTAIANAAGEVLERYRYSAYGAPTVLDADFTPREDNESLYGWETRYAGYRWDAESGLYQVRMRHLNSTIGCWLTRDTLSLMDYMKYVNNRPLVAIDPLGRDDIFPGIDTRNLNQYVMDQVRREQSHAYDVSVAVGGVIRDFDKWYENDSSVGDEWTKGLIDCPCELNRNSDGCFVNPDPALWNEPSTIPFKKYHPGGTVELRSLTPNKVGAGQQCVYDSTGKLINTGPSAGTIDRFSPPNSISGAAIDAFVGSFFGPEMGGATDIQQARHVRFDVDPFDAALRIDNAIGKSLIANRLPDLERTIQGNRYGEYVRRYAERRPPNRGKDSNGDPCTSNTGPLG